MRKYTVSSGLIFILAGCDRGGGPSAQNSANVPVAAPRSNHDESVDATKSESPVASAPPKPVSPEEYRAKMRKTLAELPKIHPYCRFQIKNHTRAYNLGIQLSADATRVAVGASKSRTESVVQVWSIEKDPKQLMETKLGGGGFALSPSGKKLLVSFVNDSVLDVDTAKPVGKLKFVMFSHAFFRDEDTVVMTSRSHEFSHPRKGHISVMNMPDGSDVGSFDLSDDRFEVAFPFENKEFWLLFTAEKAFMECYDVNKKKSVRTITPRTSTSQ